VPSGISIGDLIEGRNIDRDETDWGINYKLFLGTTTTICLEKILFENEWWIGG